jgi:hypothetical protein
MKNLFSLLDKLNYWFLLVVIGLYLMSNVNAHYIITRSDIIFILSLLFGVSTLILSGILLFISFVFPGKIAYIIRKTLIILLLLLLLVY